MIIDMFPIFIHYLIIAVWGHVSESVKTRIETYDSVKDTAKPAFYAASAYASWNIIFGGIYNLFDSKDNTQSRAQYTNRVGSSSHSRAVVLILNPPYSWRRLLNSFSS